LVLAIILCVLAGKIEFQQALQGRVEAQIEDEYMTRLSQDDLLQAQIDLLEEELSGDIALEDVPLRLIRLQNWIDRTEVSFPATDRKTRQIAFIRLRVLTALSNSQN
jgi:hypothetical protein